MSMRKRFLLSLFAFLTVAFGPNLFADSGAFKVDEIAIDGNRRIDTAAIKMQLKVSPGMVTAEQVSGSIKELYRTGFFDQVSASVVTSDTKPVRSILKFVLVEKPIIRKIFITGNEEVKEKDLSDIFKFDTKRFIDNSKIEQLKKNAISFYQSKGFYDVAFAHTVVPVGENQVDLTLTVSEGTRYKIRGIEFKGLKDIDQSDLRSVMETKRYKWWSSWLFSTGRLNPGQIDNDRNLLRQYFVDHGYIDATVGEPEIEKRDDGLYIVLQASEGRQYKIGKVRATGDLVDGDEAKTLEGIGSQTGEVFSAAQIRDDAFKISDKFSNIGYAFVNVTPGTEIERDPGTVNLNFSVEKGKSVTVDKINIRGNNKTYDRVIRREMKIDEQDAFSSAKVRRSQEVLQRLGYFEEVGVTPETKGEDKVDLNVNVREASTGSFSVGAGYSSSDGALFNTRVSESNVFGTGRSVSANVDIGTQSNNYIISYNDRRFNDSYWSLGSDILRTERDFSDFNRTLTGASIYTGYPLEQVFGEWANDMSFSFKYEYLNIDISNVNPLNAAPLVIQSEGTSSASGVTPKLTRNTIDNPLNPTKGSRQELSSEFAGLGGNEEYYLLEARNTWYHPLYKSSFGNFIFSWRTVVGYGDSYTSEPFPLFRRYFPGGINSVRGYRNRTLGPKDARGNEYGGSKELVNNWEMLFPIINSAGLQGVVFYDAGQAFDDNQSIQIKDLRLAYGAGLRWTSPLGPIRIEFGFPIAREEGESAMVTLFSFGAPL